ncbi:MAG: DUF11 domain-containing protein, partial [Gammaproteobacteria bacterium]|nr:DUF11 domain-containing protein [Gammaproteobacteria bacterium]
CAFLAPTQTCVLSGTYQVSADDVLAGAINNIGTGSSDQTPESASPVNLPVPNPSLAVVKQVVSISNPDLSDGGTSIDEAGDKITYDIVVTNNGTANLTNVTVDDDLTGTVNALCTPFLAPEDSCTVTVMYMATQDDLDLNGTNPTSNGFVDNTATGDSVQADPMNASVQVPVIQLPDHELIKTFDPELVGVGEFGEFTLVYTNTGNVTLSDIDIEDMVQVLLAVESVDDGGAVCSDDDDNVQTIFCEVDTLAPGESVTITVTYLAAPLTDELVPDTGQTSGANYVFYFENGHVLYGSTGDSTATLLDPNGFEVDPVDWSVEGRNQDIYLTVPFGGDGFQLHLSCSEIFIDGWGDFGPTAEDDPDWRILAYSVDRFNTNGLFKDCGQTFAPFYVDNVASAAATPAGGMLDPNPIIATDTVEIINIAPIDVTRERVRRGDVEIQYFNTSYEDIEIDIIRVEWADPNVLLESASYQDGVNLGISGCDLISGTCVLSASIDTIMPARSKDWLKLSFTSGDAPDGLKVIVVTSTGATLIYEFGL